MTVSPPARTDAFRKKDPSARIERSPEELFGELDEGPFVAYVGLQDISVMKGLASDARSWVPSFMCHGCGYEEESLITEAHSQSLAMWAGNGDINTGLHFDENEGGFLLVVTGRKDVVLFPPSDLPQLYLRNRMESSVFVEKQLGSQGQIDQTRQSHPLLWQTSPYFASLEAGDVLYIPHRWFHEIKSLGRSIALSAWVRPSGSSPPQGDAAKL